MKKYFYLILAILTFFPLAFCDEKIDLEKAVKDLGSDQYDTRLKAKKTLEFVGVKAIPVLRKVNNSDDLETKEFAEKTINDLITYQDQRFKIEKMLGTDSNVVSIKKFYDEYSIWLKELFLSSYEKNSEKNPKWDKQLRKLIIMWLDHFVGLALENEINDIYHLGRSARNNEMEIRKLINELTTLECKEPLFLFLRSALYFVWNDYRNTTEESAKVRDEIIKSNYSNYFKYYATIRAKWSNPAAFLLGDKTPEAILESNNILKFWVEMSNETPLKTPIAQRRYVQWANDFWNDVTYKDLEKNIDKISENFGKDSWADHAIRAKLGLKKAWAAREGKIEWNGQDETPSFETCLAEAEKHAIAAYQLRPEFLEPLTELITIKMSQTTDNIRPWFEKGAKAEINNPILFLNYSWYLHPNQGGSNEDLLSFGREFLVINNPKVNTAKFYMSALMDVLKDDPEVYKSPGVMHEVEWAVEQQVAFKTIYSNFYYIDLAMAAFCSNDFQKTIKAIQDTKGFFSAGWYPLRFNSGFIENYSTMVEKYKNKPIGEALREYRLPEMDKKSEHFKTIFDRLNLDIEVMDKPKIISILSSLNQSEDLSLLTNSVIDEFANYGYHEMVLHMYTYYNLNNDKLKSKLIQKYGDKTIAAIDLIITKNFTRNELAEKIKLIFLKNNQNEKNLDKNDEYTKSQIRGCINQIQAHIDTDSNFKSIETYIKNLQNIGDACDFTYAYIYPYIEEGFKVYFEDSFQRNILNKAERNITLIDQEMKRLSNIDDNKILVDEVQKTWKAFGSPVMVLEMVKLLRLRKLDVEAEKLNSWAIFCLESTNIAQDFDAKTSELLLHRLSIYPGNDKEAYQMGMQAVKAELNNANHYLMAYHISKLGNYHLAYELLCRGQKLPTYEETVVFNKKEYLKPDDLLQAVVNEMLAEKELPEYIRFNLKDQFDVKFKK